MKFKCRYIASNFAAHSTTSINMATNYQSDDFLFCDENYLSEVPENFSCPICLCSVQRNAHLTDCCGHHFCLQCIKPLHGNGKPCPLCKSTKFRIYPNKERQREINSLTVRCVVGMTSSQKQCDWTGELSKLEEHANNQHGLILDTLFLHKDQSGYKPTTSAPINVSSRASSQAIQQVNMGSNPTLQPVTVLKYIPILIQPYNCPKRAQNTKRDSPKSTQLSQPQSKPQVKHFPHKSTPKHSSTALPERECSKKSPAMHHSPNPPKRVSNQPTPSTNNGGGRRREREGEGGRKYEQKQGHTRNQSKQSDSQMKQTVTKHVEKAHTQTNATATTQVRKKANVTEVQRKMTTKTTTITTITSHTKKAVNHSKTTSCVTRVNQTGVATGGKGGSKPMTSTTTTSKSHSKPPI